ncbi:PHP domain-containing protein [Methermicoccus shengliensis]|uniref:Histidinol phosphatase n=1 Tax=Methermicoccus shengliensis TaxID=660064 RepID=A0A832RX60_9EURY|nr:PHP domain-containing protein [Methermicoccus shengliensis]KUK04370.1 MAG: PHP domain protein [Euryarchaeota archaeon 55_53]KUK30181.1 MAG: PHP domain protein [Methanosarcinales archeaon 56_1174]MDI3488454.1 hypothetical protein [Methanosarcinales archaeon]MDN5295741.1 hypothetical protein [Methanosarcinales archaeon]HIH69021.1 histidinol phosphatase [Methermicoccus shengliensis]
MDCEKLRLDMHVHSHFSHDSINSVERLFKSYLSTGVIPIVCDHNSIEGSERLRSLMRKNRIEVPCPLAEEIATADGEVIGIFLTEEVPQGLSCDETLDIIHEQGALALVPHPFDVYRSKVIRREVLERMMPRIHIIEGYNARNVRKRHNARAVEFARLHHKPISAGSDAHTPLELGRTYVEVEPFDTPAELLKHLPHAKIVFRKTSPAVHIITKLVMMVRR